MANAITGLIYVIAFSGAALHAHATLLDVQRDVAASPALTSLDPPFLPPPEAVSTFTPPLWTDVLNKDKKTTVSGAPVWKPTAVSGAPLTISGAPVAVSGAPVAISGAPLPKKESLKQDIEDKFSPLKTKVSGSPVTTISGAPKTVAAPVPDLIDDVKNVISQGLSDIGLGGRKLKL